MSERTARLPGAEPGVELFARWVGAGPLVFALHGGPGASHDYLRPQFDLLATGRTLLYYDQRGGGQSSVRHKVDVTWRAHVADLEHLVRAEAGGPATLLGFSWGGLLALLFALEHPDLVARLALVGPAPVWMDMRRRYTDEFARRQNAPAVADARRTLMASDLPKSSNAYRRRAFELSVAGYFRDPSRAVNLTPFKVRQDTQHAVWASLENMDLRIRVGAVSQPTLILHGRHDPVPLEASETLAHLMPDAHLVVFEDSGHALYAEETEKFVREMDGFLPKDRQ